MVSDETKCRIIYMLKP